MINTQTRLLLPSNYLKTKDNDFLTYIDFIDEIKSDTLKNSLLSTREMSKVVNIFLSKIESIVDQINFANQNGEKSLLLNWSKFFSKYDQITTPSQCKIMAIALKCIHHVDIELIEITEDHVSEIKLKWGEKLFIKGLKPYTFNPQSNFATGLTYNDFKTEFEQITENRLRTSRFYPQHSVEFYASNLLKRTENIAERIKQELINNKLSLTIDLSREIESGELRGIANALYAVNGILIEKFELNDEGVSKIHCTWLEDHLSLNPLTKSFVNFRKEKKFTDYNFVCEEQVFPCHKMILAARSSHFNALFEGKFDLNDKEFFKLKGSPKVVETLLQYLYSEITQIPNDFSIKDTFQLIDHASYFMLKFLEKECRMHINSLASKYSCQHLLDRGNQIKDILELAEDVDADALKAGCEDYLIDQIHQEKLSAIIELQKDFNLVNLQKEICRFQEKVIIHQ
ncbi:MAG: BTB/POZ domain-containing protein [Candidatus Protochlamydia sp.]|nr:BTB/POZ domain-containing protein [Candidatus Protochlamydia sp.]